MELSKREKRKLKLEMQSGETPKAPLETVQRDWGQGEFSSGKKKSRWKICAGIAGIVLLAVISYSAYSQTRPGPYDDFAKCLASNGAVVYGAIDWCKYTQAQRAMFGNSWKYLDYQDFTKLEGIRKTPTWVIDGEWHENVQSFDRLAELTGCSIAG